MGLSPQSATVHRPQFFPAECFVTEWKNSCDRRLDNAALKVKFCQNSGATNMNRPQGFISRGKPPTLPPGQPPSPHDGSPRSQDRCSHQQMFGGFKDGRSARAVFTVHTQPPALTHSQLHSAPATGLGLGDEITHQLTSSICVWWVGGWGVWRGKHTMGVSKRGTAESQTNPLTLAAILLVLK